MDTIQIACARIATFSETLVQELAEDIAKADRLRDNQYSAVESELFSAKAEIKVLRAACKSKDAQIKKLNIKLAEQSERLAELLHEQFSSKSETSAARKRRDASIDEGAVGSKGLRLSPNTTKFAAEKPKKPRNTSGRGPKNWDNLERIPIPVNFPETCPCGCGGTIRGYETDEKREVIPAKFYVAVRKYPKYRCRKDNVTIGTLYEPTLMPGLTSGTGILAYLVTMRYGWGMPLYRVENMLNHDGITFYRGTMCKQIGKLSLALKRVTAELQRHTLDDASRIFFDETPLKILRPRTGRTGQSYMYAAHRDDSSFGGNAPRSTAFFHRTTRSMTHIHGILGGKSLIVQHDGYPGYGRLGQSDTDVANIVSVECWVHARRNFIKAAKTANSPFANEVVELMGKLFDIESTIRGQPPDARLSYRKHYSAPIIQELRSRLREAHDEVLKRESLGKAINYTLKRWDSLTQFLDDGRIDLDTNPVERQFKPIILQRKGSLFIGSEEGGNTWAAMSSLVETCKLNRVDTYRYFKWMIDDLATLRTNYLDEDIDFSRYLPWNAPAHCMVKLPPVQ
ncbi:IS66 family transposase [Leisingera sp. JC1]|uniref:IS66 family transposase n=1 Tax=Leisingera sp. JC1 TaxID=1855282 RepID=UPI0015863A8E|nr:IS66 family transposase [Leisingera sp. JC1]